MVKRAQYHREMIIMLRSEIRAVVNGVLVRIPEGFDTSFSILIRFFFFQI
jgi:hypothetical protein